MIYSSMNANDDWSKYPEAIRRALNYLKETDIAAMDPGDYPLEGDEMYVKVFDNTSKTVEETHMELHKKYMDLQFFVTGGELMGFCPKTKDYEVVETDESQDLYLVTGVENEQFIRLVPGDYIMLFPNDVHRPGITDTEPSTYRKAVVKISMDLVNEG